MPDQITRLLDQIDRLDQQATTGPWLSHYGGNPHDEWLSVEPKTGSRTICTVTDDHQQNAELIALARTAMPALAQTVRAVLELHRPETRWSYEPEPEYSFRTRPGLLDHFGLDGEPYNPSHISQWQICAYCAEVEQGAAEDLGHLTALWPCTTYKTITKALGDDDAG